jgi:hypothetical protein
LGYFYFLIFKISCKNAKKVDEFQIKYFQEMELGKISNLIPDALIDALLKNKHPQGCKGFLSPSGRFRVMLLKHYTGLSDEDLVESLNTNWSYQLFCGLNLEAGEFIRDKTYVTRIRRDLSPRWKDIHDVLGSYWQGHLKEEELKAILIDATCYESYIRYPTDVKLLWESCDWLHSQTVGLCKLLSIKRPRNKFIDLAYDYDSYSKTRKKTHKMTKKMRKRLLYLLEKLIQQIQELFNKYKVSWMGEHFYERFNTIKTVFQQQTYLIDKSDSSLPNRIVSLFKPFIRPIVRGKEVKRVEFGAKAHLVLCGGLAWIEHLSFDAFHEGVRFKKTIMKHEYTHKVEVKIVGADLIYANNANRRHATKKGITTNFPKKGGRITAQEKQAKQIIHNARASQMEGVFGNQKNHYLLNKIRAKTQPTEEGWICMGILTANAVKLANKIAT